MTTFHLVTLFPESFESYLGSSILKRAQEKGIVKFKYYNPRDYAEGKKEISKEGKNIQSYVDRRIDNRPYGGGPGMVIEALPVIKAIEKAIGKKIPRSKHQVTNKSQIINLTPSFANDRVKSPPVVRERQGPFSKIKIVYFSPAGKQFTNQTAEGFKKYTDIVLVCGRYEGIDARVKKAFPMVDISVGPYVVTGGELPAMIMIDAITRRIPGVLGDFNSIEEERVSSSDVYTRPEVISYKGKKYKVPKILLGGHHAKIEEWKKVKNKMNKK